MISTNFPSNLREAPINKKTFSEANNRKYTNKRKLDLYSC